MQCGTCQQTNFIPLQGRLICKDCGDNAAERLHNFKPAASTKPPAVKTDPFNVLDLSGQTPPHQTVKQPQQHLRSTSAGPPTVVIKAKKPASAPLPVEPSLTAAIAAMQPAQSYTLKPPAVPVQALTTETRTAGVTSRGRRLSSVLASSFSRTFAGGLAALLLIGYVTYLNYPGLAIRIAAARANIPASMPGYLPDGYRFDGPIAYGQGELELTFDSGDDTLTLAQSASPWDSASLLENRIRQQSSRYSTYQENGLTIYTYDGRTAVWVNSGVLYEISSSAFIDPEEIVKMASSL